ncbi:MAG: hypothetical protein KJ006_13000, partial [Thermoleophilia bacterium]|nr:hypothetical protein [Thermoleophilia bacterium]
GVSATAAGGSTGAADQGAARLVAMNMALDGAERETITAHLRGEFGEVPDVEGLIDEVMSRAKR